MILRCTTATRDFDACLDVDRIEFGGPDGVVLCLASGLEVRLGSASGGIVPLDAEELDAWLKSGKMASSNDE